MDVLFICFSNLRFRYQIEPVPVHEARQAFGMSANSMSYAKQSLVAGYLTCSIATADTVVEARQLLDEIAGDLR